jgi:hypothetical protein
MRRQAGFLSYLVDCCAGWIQRRQAGAMEYLKAEDRVLRARLAGRLTLKDVERRQLARKAAAVGRAGLFELDPSGTPDTLPRWHRQLVARKWTYAARRQPGRPRARAVIEALMVRMPTENPRWGCARIQGAVSSLDYRVGCGTVRLILFESGLEPSPERGRRTRCSVFLKAYWRALVATDFATVDVWSWRGLLTHYVLWFIGLATRRVLIAGLTTNPGERWMRQIARNGQDVEAGLLSPGWALLMGRDAEFSARFRSGLVRDGIAVIRVPPRSPSLNACPERFFRLVKDERLDRAIPIGPAMLRRPLREYAAHFHGERNHQGLGNQLIRPSRGKVAPDDGPIRRSSRLGGLLSYYGR